MQMSLVCLFSARWKNISIEPDLKAVEEGGLLMDQKHVKPSSALKAESLIAHYTKI